MIGETIYSWFFAAPKPPEVVGPKWGYIPCRGCGMNVNALVIAQDGLCPPCRKDKYGKS